MQDGEVPILVGRSRERDLIHAQVSAALEGHGGLVILSGEAGIGKTSLANDASRTARAQGALLLIGNCYDRTETPPYGPWIELLNQFRALPDRPSALLEIPEPNLTRSSSQSALFAEMRAFLVAVARERPVVILLEDMQWADTASLDLLRVVARQLASVPILLLVTYRSDEVNRQHPLYQLLPMLVREALAVRIDLWPLRDDDVRALIEYAYDLSENDVTRLVTYLQAHAEGNPFFIGELVRTLEETVLNRTTSGWSLGHLAQLQVPMLLQQVIDARLARLGAEADKLLQVAAVIGEVVPLALWGTVAETNEEALFPLLRRAIDARVLHASSDGLTVHFSHALIREALYESILPPRRRMLHHQVGEALEAHTTAAEPDIIAYHFGQAGDKRAVVWLIQAGERAQRAFAYRTAAHRFESALSSLEGNDATWNEQGWLHLRVALLRRFQDPLSGVAKLAEAERMGTASNDAALVAYAHYFQGMLRRMAGDFQQGTATTEEGIALLDALSPLDHARLAALNTTSDPLDPQNGRGDLTLTLGEIGPFARAVTLGEQLIGLPPDETFGSRGDAYYGLGYAYAALGQPEAARQAFTRAREIFRADDHRNMVLASLFDELVLTVLPYQTDRSLERQRLEADLAELFTTLEDIFDPSSARIARIVSILLEGNLDEALTTVLESDLRFIRLVGLTLVAPLARELGKVDLAWSLVQEGLPAGPFTQPGDSAGHIVPLRTLAVLLSLDAGDHDTACQWLTALDCWLEWSGGVLGQSDAHRCWAEYYRAVGDLSQARARAKQALAAAREPRQPLALIAAHRLLGELDLADGRLVDAEEQLAASLMLAETCGARHEQALTRLDMADLALLRGDRSAAREQLGNVRAVCTPMGAALTLAKVNNLEARLARNESNRSTALPAGLTPREGDVLRLLAVGLSNTQIAEQLSLSPRTVSAHLTAIYSKLGVTARGAAIRFALDHDLH